MNTIKVPKEELLNSDAFEDPIECNTIDHTRWSVVHKIILKWTDGKTYSAIYSTGATEMQDESPWQYQDEVELTEVKQVEKVVKVWVPA